ncbi:MAG: hypothetical protein JXR83_01510 [Deltaproteobacteria bacterium]|nr:hypothetical protein [Deltaproteobacteria bacterium]
MNLLRQNGRPAIDIIARLGRQLAHLQALPGALPGPPPLNLVERASADDGDFIRIQRWTQWVVPRRVRQQTAFWVVPPADGAALGGPRPQDGAGQ